MDSDLVTIELEDIVWEYNDDHDIFHQITLRLCPKCGGCLEVDLDECGGSDLIPVGVSCPSCWWDEPFLPWRRSNVTS